MVLHLHFETIKIIVNFFCQNILYVLHIMSTVIKAMVSFQSYFLIYLCGENLFFVVVDCTSNFVTCLWFIFTELSIIDVLLGHLKVSTHMKFDMWGPFSGAKWNCLIHRNFGNNNLFVTIYDKFFCIFDVMILCTRWHHRWTSTPRQDQQRPSDLHSLQQFDLYMKFFDSEFFISESMYFMRRTNWSSTVCLTVYI